MHDQHTDLAGTGLQRLQGLAQDRAGDGIVGTHGVTGNRRRGEKIAHGDRVDHRVDVAEYDPRERDRHTLRIGSDSDVTTDLEDTFYGDRRYTARDPEGFEWTFATRVKEVAPQDWEPSN